MRIVYSPEAEAQLLDLYRHIAREASPTTAERFTAAVIERCETLQTFAHRGAPRDEIRPGMKILNFRRRVTIAYLVARETVTILGIFHGGRDYDSALRDT